MIRAIEVFYTYIALLLFQSSLIAQNWQEIPLPVGPYHCDDLIEYQGSIVSHQYHDNRLYFYYTDDRLNWKVISSIGVDSLISKARLQKSGDELLFSYSTSRDSQLYIHSMSELTSKIEMIKGPIGTSHFAATSSKWWAAGKRNIFYSSDQGETWNSWGNADNLIYDLQSNDDLAIVLEQDQITKLYDNLTNLEYNWATQSKFGPLECRVENGYILLWKRIDFRSPDIVAVDTGFTHEHHVTLSTSSFGSHPYKQDVRYDGTTLYVGIKGGLHTTDDWGNSWTIQTAPYDVEELLILDNSWSCAGENGFFWSEDKGCTWTSGNQGSARDSLFQSYSVVTGSRLFIDEHGQVIVSGYNRSYFSNDSGETWKILHNNQGDNYLIVGSEEIMIDYAKRKTAVRRENENCWADRDSLPESLQFLGQGGDVLIYPLMYSNDLGKTLNLRGDSLRLQNEVVHIDEGFFTWLEGKLYHSETGDEFYGYNDSGLSGEEIIYVGKISEKCLIIQTARYLYLKESYLSLESITIPGFTMSARRPIRSVKFSGNNCIMTSLLNGTYISENGGKSWEAIDHNSIIGQPGLILDVAVDQGFYFLWSSFNPDLPEQLWHRSSTTSSAPDLEFNNPFTLFPNPTDSKICIENEGRDWNQMTLTSLEGKVMLNQSNIGSNCITLPDNILPGIYMVRIDHPGSSSRLALAVSK